MNSKFRWAHALLSLCLLSVGMFGAHGLAFGQNTVPPSSSQPNPSGVTIQAPPVSSAAQTACCAFADGVIIELEIAEPLSSKTAQRGQRFKLRLVSPLFAGDVMALPAGTEGYGEVVHADRARAAGKPGELLLTGRSLIGPNGEIKLRGFRLGGSGENRSEAAFWIPLGFFIRGGQIEIPVGTRAHAKLAGPYQFTPASQSPAQDIALSALPSSDPAQGATPADHNTDASKPQPRH